MSNRDNIRAALACIPADDRELWLRIGMAIHSEHPDDDGFTLFDDWSRSGDTYDARAVRDTWRSFKPGRVTLGTLWHEAKARGYRPAAPIVPEPAAERERQQRQRAERRAAEEVNYRARADRAAREAARLWAEASATGSSPYLQRKRVQGRGVRYLVDGTVLVPVRNAAGELVNLQRIAPTKPTPEEEQRGRREKRFLPGGRKSGCWHLIGAADGADLVMVCEGFATGCSLFEATGRPVAVAFDAGNLLKVALALAELYPSARLLIAGDDDRDTAARTGTNPGRDKATAAARAVQGLAVFPDGLPEGMGSDMNDLAQHAGADAVRVLIDRAAGELVAGVVQTPAPRGRRQRTEGQGGPQRRATGSTGTDAPPSPDEAHSGPPDAAGDPSDDADGPPVAPAAMFDRFAVGAEGVFFTEHDNDGRERAPLWVCSRLAVTARTRDGDGDGWGYLLEFDDPTGKPRTWAMPARMLAGDGAEYRAVLLGMGLRIASGTKARNLLTQYLQTRQPAEIARCADRVGWHGRAFVLPRETIQRQPADGDNAPERIVYQTDGPSENPFRQRGTLATWRDKVAALCVGNSRLTFAASCAFAGPLMRPASIASGGVHFRGESQSGKSTAQYLAASVYGDRSYKQSWRATDNALEAVAAQACDCLLILDELAQVDPKSAGEVAYMLGNEAGKSRSTRSGQTRPRLTWRLLFLSTGEVSLADHMAEGGKRVRAGQEVRMVNIPAEVTPGTCFETTHGIEGGAAFAQHIDRVTVEAYGHAGRVWLQWLVDHVDTLRDRTREGIDRLTGAWVPDAASGQVHSVGRRFALVAVAGELATAAGVTGWAEGEATAAAKACFLAWLQARPGGIGNAEQAQMLTQVRRWLQLNGAGRFTWWHRAMDDRAPDKGLRAGFRRMMTADGKPIHKNTDHMREYGEEVQPPDAEDSTVDHFVFAPVFDAEACEGFDPGAVKRLLRDRGHLVPDKGRPFDCKPRLPGLGPTKCYRIRASIFEGDDD